MKLFEMKDENFICSNCMNEVTKLGYSARNHCPLCLCSIHVDNNPGDRLNDCRGILRPIMIDGTKKSKYVIKFKCDKCDAIKNNVSAVDDNFEKILDVMKGMDN